MSVLSALREFLFPTWEEPQRALTPAQLFNTGYLDYTDGWWSASGQAVTPTTVMEAAQGACARLLADDIASLPLDVFRREGPATLPVDPPDWVRNPTGMPFDSAVSYISDWVTSIALDGNAFTLVTPNIFRPERLEVLDPDRVTVEKRDGRIIYRYGSDDEEPRELSPTNVMHVTWVRIPGALRGINPVQSARDSIGLELAARKWAGAFFRNGGTLGGIVEVPGGPETVDADRLREQFEARHKGEDNWWKPAVLTGGAKYDDRSISPKEADLSPLWMHVLEEAARVYHIPPHMLASQQPGGSSYSSIEHRSIEYVMHAIRPFVTRFEAAHSRLVDPAFIKLNMNALMRGDSKTRAEYYSFMVNNVKAMKREEVRDLEDLPYDGELGYLDTPNNVAPQEQEAPADRSLTIDTVTIGDDSAQRIADTAAAGAAVAAAEARKLAEKVSEDVRELTETVRMGAENIARLSDDRDRIYELLEQRNAPPDIRIDGEYVYYQRGTEVVRKRVTRDERGRVVGMVGA